MLPHDKDGKIGPRTPLPDHVQIHEPREDTNPTVPYSEPKNVEKDQNLGIQQPQSLPQQY
jgi:small subunit ribosomal protein S3e